MNRTDVCSGHDAGTGSGRARRRTLGTLAAVALTVVLGGAGASPPDAEDGAGEDGFRLKGTLVVRDGGEIPEDLELRAMLRWRRGTSHRAPERNGAEFVERFRRDGEVYISARTGRYAPVFLGPIEPGPDGVARCEVVLREGARAEIRLRSREGRPVEGAELEVRHLLAGRSWIPVATLTTDASGTAVLEHTPDAPLVLDVQKRGYEWDRREDVRLSGETPLVWKLRPALGATGVVLSHRGEPVAGAELRTRSRSGPFAMSFSGDTGPLLGTTGEDGRFTLATLRRDTSYAVAIDAAGHGVRVVDRVSAGERDIEVRLPVEERVRGTVTGDLSRLPRRRGQARIAWSDVLRDRARGHSSSTHRWADVAIEGEVGRFVLRDVAGTHVEIGGKTWALPEDPGETLEVHVALESEEERQPAKRRLRVRFVLPREDGPAIAGTIAVASHVAGDRRRRRSEWHRDVPIEDGEARVEVSAPGTAEIAPALTEHYTFDEREVEVPAGTDEITVDLLARRAGAIAGQVLLPDGSPSGRGVSLSCYQRTGEGSVLHNFDTGANGRFLITPLELGHEWVVAALRGKVMVLSERVRVERSNPRPEVRCRLVEGLPIRGKLVDPEGRPASEVPVTAHLEHPWASRSWSPGTHTTRLGLFDLGRFNPHSGTMQVRASPTRDFQPRRQALRTDGETTVIELERGEVLEGRVVGAESGEPLRGVELYAMPDEPGSQSARIFRYLPEGPTDREGRFRFSTLPPRRCRIGIDSGARRPPGTRAPRAIPGAGDEVTLRAVPRE